MSVPLNLILKELEGSPDSILPIISTLYYDKSILNEISKPDLKHLISRTLNLAKSGNEFNKWCGINLIRVLAGNYNILANEGVVMFGQLLKNLEDFNDAGNIKILTSTVESLNFLCQKIRGKPTLTREILTPKLGSIITLYMEKLHYHPYLIVKSLKELMKNHPTTFRPFGNKLRSKLVSVVNLKDFNSFPENLKTCIYETLALLPIIEKTDPENKWESNVHDIIRELHSILNVYNEFLNLSDDGDLTKLLNKLPKHEGGEKLLPDLSIDVNQPNSILQISTRIEILLNLLKAHLTSETPFSIKVPIGLILIVHEIICSLNLKFVSFRTDIRDDTIKSLIKATTTRNQLNSIKCLKSLALTFKGGLLPHLHSILSFLEVLIPFKNKKIDYNDLIANEVFNSELLSCVAVYVSLVSNLGDNSQLLRFVDIALLLVEPRLNNATLEQQSNGTNNKKLKNKKKNQSSVPLADILSHQHLFAGTISTSTIKAVREFLRVVISTVSLPPTQHYKIMRYLIIEAVNASYYNSEHMIPKDLKALLVNAVIYPGYEKISLLPIVSSLLPNEPLLSIFNNPRFPPLPVYIKKVDYEDVEMEDEDEEEDEEEKEESSSKRRKVDSDSNGEAGDGASVPDTIVEDIEIEDKQIFTAKPINADQIIELPPKEIVETVEEIIETAPAAPIGVTTTSTTLVLPQEDDSDFELPEIDVDGSDDDE